MQATVMHPSELGEPELAQWRRMQSEVPALRHPFLSAEFARAVGEVSKHARVAVVEDAGEHVGFLAYGANALGIARPIGGRLSYRQGFVHAEAAAWSWAGLMRATGVHAMEFTDLVGSQSGPDDGLAVNPSPIIDTSIGWDAYLEHARNHSDVRKAMQRGRRLEREHGPLDFTWGPVSADVLARLIAWKSEQYRRSGWPDPFARPWIRDVLDVLAERSDGDLRLLSATIRAGDDLVAADMSLVYGDVLAAWISSYNDEYARYSPGSIRRLRTIRHACEAHLAYIDLARGDEPYKQDFKNADLMVATGLLREHAGSALLYRAVHTPYQGTRSWILRRPRTRALVRSSLRNLGSLRVKVRPHGAAPRPAEPAEARRG